MDSPKLRFKGFTDTYNFRRTGDYFTHIRNGFVGTATPYYTDENGIKYLQSNNIKNGTINEKKIVYINEEFHKKNKKSILKTSDILMVQSGHAGDCAVVSSKYNGCNCHALIVMTPKTNINSTYYMYYLHSPNGLRQVKKLITGNTIKHILASDVKNIIFPCPKLEEQSKIANFLKVLDKKIQLQKEKIDLLKEHKKSYMQKIFSQKLRLKNVNGQEFPAWQVNKLSHYLFEHKIRNYDNIYSKKDVFSVSGEYGIVNQIAFQGRSFAGKSVENYHVVHTGDIVYTKSPLKSNPYGIIKCNKNRPGIVSTLYAVYSCKKTIVGEFLDYYFQLDDHTNSYLRPLVNKGAKNDMKINNENVLKGDIIAPLIEEQKKIIQFLKAFDNNIKLQEEKYENLIEQKKYFMQQMFI
jgi:type I restriction enzyme, S subunit